MRLQRHQCSECLNNTQEGMCPYQARYVAATAILDAVLDKYKSETDWFGSLKGTCDYYIEDLSKTEDNCSCCPKYTWRDIVKVHQLGSFQYSIEEFPISGKMDDENHYQLDDFVRAVALKYGVTEDDVECYMMDSFDFPTTVGWDVATLGCYIFGKPEWAV